jgi:hypothetical protein
MFLDISNGVDFESCMLMNLSKNLVKQYSLTLRKKIQVLFIEIEVVPLKSSFEYEFSGIILGFLFSCPQVVSCTQFSPAR